MVGCSTHPSSVSSQFSTTNIEDLLEIILVCQAEMRDPDCNPSLQQLRLNVKILSPQLITLPTAHAVWIDLEVRWPVNVGLGQVR